MSNGGSFDPQAIEQAVYAHWEASGAFHAEPDPHKRPFVIDIPLPNVTGALHLGHALNNTVQDVLIRHRRMCGFETLWMPGTDHAGIATQAVVERKLKEEQNLTRHELGREGLVKRIWEWKEEYGERILRQLRLIGCSCDWARARFTLDEICARAVYEVFFQWFKAGLIYRGERLVNWDTQLQTAVADDEIFHETVKGHLWHYRYPILQSGGEAGELDAQAVEAAVRRATAPDAQLGRDYLVIATTRPETMLGDTAIAVHPDDERYQHLIGGFVLLPLQNRAIPVIADGRLVQREFGTGCVKVTPAHDPNDYACAQRNNLPMINILRLDGQINENGGAYAGLDRYAARKKVVADLEALGLMEKIEDYETEIGHSDRSKTPIEPMLSEQWFVKMADLAESAMEAVRDGRVTFYPERYAKTFLDWLGEKRDWCISRQLWWGHRIPVWTKRMTRLDYVRWAERQGRAHDLMGENDDMIVSLVADDGELYTAGGPTYSWREEERAIDELGYDEPVFWQICLRNEDVRFVLEPETCIASFLESNGFERDPDVLDTWFSSAIWPFSTLGWPDDYGRARAGNALNERDNQSRDRKGAVGERDEHVQAPLPHGRGTDAGGRGAESGGGSDPSIPRSLVPSFPSTDLSYFYPTSTLVTAREIITLWVARMVMTGLYFTGRAPFQHVHIHPNIQDGQGRRMSKSAGNGVDPVDIVNRYGADALRFTMAQMDSETQDARLPVAYACPHCGALTPQGAVVPQGSTPSKVHEVKCSGCQKPFATVWAPPAKREQLGVGIDTSERFEMGRNFANKIWQAATGFVLPNITAVESDAASPGATPQVRPLTDSDLALEDHWILSRLAATIADVDARLARYQISDVTSTLYSFFWNDFCDWYVELVKPRLYRRDEAGQVAPQDDGSARVARQVLAWVLDQSLRLLHPLMPFVTEAVWEKLNAAAPRRGVRRLHEAEPLLITARWPDAAAWRRDPDVEAEIGALQNVIRGLRDTLAWINMTRAAAKQGAIGKLPQAVIRAAPTLVARLAAQEAVICRLGRCEALQLGAEIDKPPESATKVYPGVELFVPIAGLADLDVERKRLGKERDQLAGHIQRIQGKLANESFVSKAPPAVVQKERERLGELEGQLAALERSLAELGT